MTRREELEAQIASIRRTKSLLRAGDVRDASEKRLAELEAELAELKAKADRSARLNALHTGTYKAGE